uniref:Dystrophin n=1 Tax=Parascaris univalens TaxID=6257 RepID=A0A915ACG1_PARUN
MQQQQQQQHEHEDEQLHRRDDRFDIQESVFVRWANSIANEPVREINDVIDSKFFFNFVHLITGEMLESTGSRVQDITNALHVVDVDDRFAQVNITELLDGNSRAICGVIWQLIQIFWKRYAPEGVRDQKLAEAIKDWCLERTQNFEEVQINDFTSSWRDGYAINAILLSYNPELFDMDNVRQMRGDERIEHAMGIAERHLNVPRLLKPKDFHSEHLDLKSVVTYLMMIYLSISTQTPPTPKRRSSTRSSTTVILRADSQELPSTVVQQPPVQILPAEVRTASEQQPLEQYIAEPQGAVPEQHSLQQQIMVPEQCPVEPTVALTQGQYLAGQQLVTQSPCMSGEQIAMQTQYLAEQKAAAQLMELQTGALEQMLAEQQATAQRQYLEEQQPLDPVQYDSEKQTAVQRIMPQEQCLAAYQAAIQQTAAVAQQVAEQEVALQKQYATEPKAIGPEQLLTEQGNGTSNEQSSVGSRDKVLNQGLGEQQSVNVGQCPMEQQTISSTQEMTVPKPAFTNHPLTERQLVIPEESASVHHHPEHPDTDQRTFEQRSSEQSQIHSHPHQQHSESSEIRSRKSSSSSQKSRKSRRSAEDTITEYELCLEQVLAWLLEAEEQANSMDPVEEENVEVVKTQFREHEQFMQSLTESQDSVGRVLHRGQVLCQKLEEEQSATILSQLLMVNARWERVRDLAMSRQNLLQQRLNTLQLNQLEAIRKWLEKIEEEIEQTPTLSLDADEVERLIRIHSDMQEKIEEEQKAVRALSTFVAVVDESDTQLSYEDLEKLLHSVGQRWMAICEWAELRARQLDGLSALIRQYNSAYEQLSEWLDHREEALEGLRSVERLESEAEVAGQVERVQQVEAALEAGHADFVALSQLAVDLVAKLDASNGAAANQIRRQIDTTTQRWDNIVSRIDQHSQMLVKSGKAEAQHLQHEISDADETDRVERRSADIDTSQGNVARLSTVQFTSFEPVGEALASSTSTVSCSTVISPVDIFIANVKRVSDDLEPLIEWTHNFTVSKNPDDIRQVIQICQGKLREIKEKEGEVNELHAELERIHNLDVGCAQLRLANDTFEQFTRKWSRIVTKISDALNTLSSHAETASDENFDAETKRIATELDEFFDSALSIVSNCAQIAAKERETRLDKLREQLAEQEKNIAFLNANLLDCERVDALKKRADEVNSAIDALSEVGSFEERFERFLRDPIAAAGDSNVLSMQLAQCEDMLDELKNKEIVSSKHDQLQKLGIAKRNNIREMLEKTRQCDEKIIGSESALRQFRQRLDSLKSEQLEFPELIGHFRKLRDDLQKDRLLQKESAEMAEEIASLAACSNAANRDAILDDLKKRTWTCATAWKSIEENIDESINLLEKENKRFQKGLLRDYRCAIENLAQAIDGSLEAADAEEFSEHLDNLERLSEKLEAAASAVSVDAHGEDSLSREAAEIKTLRDRTVTRAKERIDELECAVRGCEQFESSLAECQAWCNHVQLILSCRVANDVSALDVPHEYKSAFTTGTLISQLQAEFDDFERCIRSLRDFVAKNASDWGSSERLQLQLDHVASQFEELTTRFVEFKQPIGLEEKAERIARETAEMENSVDELTGLEANACSSALDHARQIGRRIAQAKADLQDLIESEKKLVDERILGPSAEQEVTKKLQETAIKLNTIEGRSTDIVRRLEKCVALLEHLNSDLSHLDVVLDDVESKLSALVQSENIEITEGDRATLETLQNELIRNEASLASIEETAESLRRESVKVDDAEIERRWKRIRRVHGDLRAWIDALNSMSEDGRSMLTQFEALYTKLEKTITEMEAVESIEELSTALEQNRAEKSVLMERYRRLLKTNAEVEAKFSLRLSELEGRWNELEKWWQRARSSPPRAPSPPQLRRIPIEGHFDHQIDTLCCMFKIAKDYIDFERYPVSSVTEWATRIQDVSEWLSEYGDRLKLLLEEGRRLASSGRMELDVHDALESLDKVVDLANQVESGVKASSALLVPVQAKADALARDMRTMRDVLTHLAARDLSEPTIASATQRDLLDRQVQLEYLHRKSDDLHRCLPGLSPNQVNTSMDEICELVRTIEEQIAIAIRKGVDEEADRSLGASTPSQPKDSTKEPDTISVSSAGAPSLALEVQETEDERSRLEYLSKSSAPPTIKIENTDSMGSFYIEMDQIEEALSKDDPFPYSDLDAKKQQLEAMSRSLDRVEQAIDDSQMMMDLIESEAARERVAALRGSSSQRTKEVNEMLRSWASLEANLNASDELVKALDTMLSDVDGRNKSPDIDELESLSLSFEDSLQRALAQIQHTSLKAEPIITQMDDEHADVLRERLRDIGERWKRCEDAVRDKRRRLDERLADQSELTNQIELLEFWCDEAEAECATAINSLNDGAIAEISDRINERLSDFESKRESLHNIERLKDRLVNAQLADPSTKHRTRRIVSELGKRVSSIRSVLTERKVELDEAADSAKQFQMDISTLQQFCDRCEKAVQIVENAKIFVPSGTDLDYVRSRQDQMDSLTNSLQERWKKACLEEPPPDDRQKIVIEDVFRMWAKAKQRISDKADVQTLAQDSSLSEAVAVEEFPSDTKRALTPSGTDEKAEQSVSEYGTLSEAPMSDEPPLPHLSHNEHALLNSIVQLRHWLAETERDAGLTIDIIDVQAVRDSVSHMQAFIDQLKIRHLELIRILDESQTRTVREKTEFTLGEWNRVLSECQRRKSQLKKMADESRAWEQLRCSVQLWLNDAQQRLSEGGKVSELSEEALRAELKEVEGISGGIEEMKNKMAELNVRSNALLDEFRADEGHNLSHSISKMNTLWSKFNDNIRIRHAVLEAAIRARSDFHSALSQLEQWLDRVESSLSSLNGATLNKQTLKDSVKRKEWIDNEKSIRAEMDAHDDVVRSVEQMGVKLVRSVEDLNERERLGDRLNSVSERWRCMSALANNIRTRLMSAQEECERLVSQLAEYIYWCDSQNNALLDEQPVGGSLARVQQQNEFIKNLEHEIDRKQRAVDESIVLAHSYLMQHDLRPRMHTPSALAEQPQDDTNAELRRVGIQIKSDSDKLAKKWSELKKQVNAWSRIIDDAHAKMEQLAAAIAECQLSLSKMEASMESMQPVEDLRLEELSDAVDDSDRLKECLARTRMHVDDANDCSGQLLASDIDLAPELTVQLKSINERFAKLKVDVKIRVAALEHAIADFGPSSQHFLMNSVQPPWQRAVSSTNHLPYYINHETEMTQWDHPVMVEIMEKLANFNQVKFSAYRTAMKLRAIQKRLCLDLLSLQELDAKLQSLNSTWGEQRLAIKDAVMCLVPLFESAHEKFPHLIRSIPLAVDLFLNFLLNIYDPSRDGTLRMFSFKVALVVLCNANLEDKYKYLYALISTNEGVDQKRLALLLYDIIYIPKFLGESAAFGGSNVEPSVRSCFETVKFSRTISVDDFLAWLKKEPQSVVWLPVMHRLASAEFAKHQAWMFHVFY